MALRHSDLPVVPQMGRSVSGFHCTHGHSCDGDLERARAEPVPVFRLTIGIYGTLRTSFKINITTMKDS